MPGGRGRGRAAWRSSTEKAGGPICAHGVRRPFCVPGLLGNPSSARRAVRHAERPPGEGVGRPRTSRSVHVRRRLYVDGGPNHGPGSSGHTVGVALVGVLVERPLPPGATGVELTFD